MQRSGNRGAALIAVLWLLALLTILATTVATVSITEQRTTRRIAAWDQERELVDSALRLTLLDLVGQRVQSGEIEVGQWQQRSVLQQHIAVKVEAERGRVDLNNASQEWLTDLFLAGGLNFTVARQGARQIVEQRGEGVASAYSPLAASARDAALRSPNALRTVGEVQQYFPDHTLSDEILDSLTLYTQQSEPESTWATALVRQAIVLHRRGDLAESPTETRQRWQVASGDVLRIHACLHADGSICRVVIVRLTGAVSHPWQILWWSDAVR